MGRKRVDWKRPSPVSMVLHLGARCVNGSLGSRAQYLRTRGKTRHTDLPLVLHLNRSNHRDLTRIPVDVSDCRVDGDPRTSVLRPQDIRWEEVIIVQTLVCFKLSRLHGLGALIPQDLLRGKSRHHEVLLSVSSLIILNQILYKLPSRWPCRWSDPPRSSWSSQSLPA